MNIQRMARGWLARHRKFKKKALEHMAAVQIVDKMITNIIEDKLIPDLLIQLFRQNELYQDVGLYSAENQSLYQTRNSILDGVLREMAREVVNAAINTMVSQFMRKRAIGPARYEEEDVLDNYLDPLSLAAKSIMDDLIRWEIRFLLQDEMSNPNKPGSLLNEYIIEGSFYPWFNNTLVKDQVRAVARDALMDCMVGEILEDMVDEQAGAMGRLAVEEAVQEEAEKENEHSFKDDAQRVVWDKLIMERLMDSFITDYVNQEEQKLIDQKERDLEAHAEVKLQLQQFNEGEAKYRKEFNARLKLEREKFDYNYDNRADVDYNAMAGRGGGGASKSMAVANAQAFGGQYQDPRQLNNISGLEFQQRSIQGGGRNVAATGYGNAMTTPKP